MSARPGRVELDAFLDALPKGIYEVDYSNRAGELVTVVGNIVVPLQGPTDRFFFVGITPVARDRFVAWRAVHK